MAVGSLPSPRLDSRLFLHVQRYTVCWKGKSIVYNLFLFDQSLSFLFVSDIIFLFILSDIIFIFICYLFNCIRCIGSIS